VLSTNEPSAHLFLGLPAVADIYPGCGPMAGIHAALRHTARSMLLVLACDLPAVTAKLLRRLVEWAEGFDVVVPMTSDGVLHPVCALYRRTCLPVMEEHLRSGNTGLLDLFHSQKVRTRRLAPGEGDFTDADLRDMDSPEDYLQWWVRISPP
jgi:molybdopterin-guanine dinucleotide biosynthesis protein A